VPRRTSKKAPTHPGPARSAIDAVLAHVAASANGGAPPDSVPTGFPSVDRLLGGGLRLGDLVVLGGDVGSGKSALALGMAVRAAEAARAVHFYAGEVSVERVAERVVAIEGRARIDDIRRGAMEGSKREALDALSTRLERGRFGVARLPAGLAELAADLERNQGVELVIVDPLQMLATGRAAQDEELATAVRGLKRLAVDHEVAVLLTAHLPQLGARPDRRPQLDDFGALGSVKQHADVVLGLFREGMYDASQSLEGATELHVLKNRSGATAYADLYFYAQWMRFEDLVDPDR